MGRTPTCHASLVLDNCEINDAKVGAYAHSGGLLDIRNSRFNNNEVHIGIDAYTAGSNGAQIINNEFGLTENNLAGHNYYTGPIGSFSHAFFIDNNSSVIFTTNRFSRNNSALQTIGTPTTSNGEVSLYLNDCNNITVGQNDFVAEVEYHLFAKNSNALDITSNTIKGHLGGNNYTNVVRGVRLEEVGGSTQFTSNTLLGCEYGLEFYNNSAGTASIEQNNFASNTYGIVVATIENPITTLSSVNNYTTPINLDIYCNRFSYCDYGVVGSGAMKDQGATSSDASNKFVSITEWEIVWGKPSGFTLPTYYYNPSPAPNQTGASINIDNLLSIDTLTLIPSSSMTSCYSTLKREPTAINDPNTQTPESKIRIYPNPFRVQLNLDGLNPDGQHTIIVYDALGRQLMQMPATGKSHQINTTELVAGIYYINVYDRNLDRVYSAKIVKE
ncbi:MAG: T9SS type A sorting domain-containing protein, partial [Bacteroidia bacterium]